jgi:hypothetical protein
MAGEGQPHQSPQGVAIGARGPCLYFVSLVCVDGQPLTDRLPFLWGGLLS